MALSSGQVLTERIPGSNESRAQGVVLGHERFEFRAGLTNMHHERGFVMPDVVGFRECLGQFTWNHLAHDVVLSTKFLQHCGYPATRDKKQSLEIDTFQQFVWKYIHDDPPPPAHKVPWRNNSRGANQPGPDTSATGRAFRPYTAAHHRHRKRQSVDLNGSLL